LDGHGLDAQEHAIKEECTRRGWMLMEILRDAGVSGKSLERPGIRRALEAVRYVPSQRERAEGGASS
jgi:DNA invertase Pin-like site-specific DNA recombinase